MKKPSIFTLIVLSSTGALFGDITPISQPVAEKALEILYTHSANPSSQKNIGETENSNQMYSQQERCNPSPHHFSLGVKYTRAYLKPKAHPSFSGNMGGIQASYEYQRPDTFYGGAIFEWRYGHLHASNGNRKLQDFNVQERLGYSINFEEFNASVTFFTGFGYRHLRHSVSLKGFSPMTLYYNHFYIPIGVTKEFKLTPCFSLGVNVVWMPQVFPTVTISPIGGARWKIKRKYTNFLAEIPLIFNLDSYVKNLSLALVPQFEIWQDGQTTVKALGFKKNTYILWSGELNVKYAF